MDVLARGQVLGHVRNDVPLRRLRSLVFGPMEHVLWDATLARRRLSQTQIETTANKLVDVLWAALQPPDAKLAALTQFRQDVEEASRRYEATSAGSKPAD